jgi:hypothetical protein
MASLLGPQWLCECNQRGGADTVAKASQEAGGHFLGHDGTGEGVFQVSVYKERNVWLYTISTVEMATDLAYPIQMVDPGPGLSTLTTSYALPPGATDYERGLLSRTYTFAEPKVQPSVLQDLANKITAATGATKRLTDTWKAGDPIELDSLTMSEANARFQATMAAMHASGRHQFSVSDVLRGN